MTAETGELFAPEPAIAAAGLAVLDDGEPDVDRALELIDAAWRRGLEAEPQLTVSEWADRHRVLPTANAEPGPWRTDRVPYLREIMDALSTSLPIERVVFMNGAQTGGTAAALNAIGYWIAHAPGIILTVWPSIDMVRRNSRIRIEPLIDGTPALRAKIPPARSKDPGNAVAQKEFPGGALVMTGANSAAGLRSLPARYLVLDEVDAFPPDADGEGDPVALAVQRTVTFRGRRKIVLISTPTFAGASRIETAFAESDQRRFFVPCPHCGAMQLIAWSSIQWPEARPREAFMACEANGCVIEERDKPKMLSHGEWRATAGGDGRTAGFHLPALYSPFESWADIAAEFLTVRRDPLRLQPWTNTKLGLPFENSEGGQFEAAKALERLEDWGDGLPEHAAVITAGVDVQGDRLAVSPGARERSLGRSIIRNCGAIRRSRTFGERSTTISCADSTTRAPGPCRSAPSASIAAVIGRNRSTGSRASARGAVFGRSRGVAARASPSGPGGLPGPRKRYSRPSSSGSTRRKS